MAMPVTPVAMPAIVVTVTGTVIAVAVTTIFHHGYTGCRSGVFDRSSAQRRRPDSGNSETAETEASDRSKNGNAHFALPFSNCLRFLSPPTIPYQGEVRRSMINSSADVCLYLSNHTSPNSDVVLTHARFFADQDLLNISTHQFDQRASRQKSVKPASDTRWRNVMPRQSSNIRLA